MLRRLVINSINDRHVIVSLTKIGELGRQLIDDGYDVHALEISRKSFLSACQKLFLLIRRIRPNVIQTWMYHSDLLGGIIGRLAGVRNIVWNIRNTEIPQRSLSVTGFIVKLCSVLSYFVPRAIICCAHAGLERHSALGYSRERMIVIPNGYETDSFIPCHHEKNDARSIYGIPANCFVVGMVGRFDWLKGYDIFIESAAQVAECCDDEVMFIMLGRRIDDKNSELKSLILNKGGRAHFKLLGQRDDVLKIMQVFDVSCLASRAEGFPNVVAESMLMEVPCVVTDVGDAAKIVGTTGKVVQPNRPSALADALLEIKGLDEVERKKMGQNARKRIIKNYDIKVIARRYSEIYMPGENYDF